MRIPISTIFLAIREKLPLFAVLRISNTPAMFSLISQI